ncbi:hypothetical protein SKAU_G00287120 [Synaphobranchus kaupii]|uniref:Uncharacterized protein n=1 Tax=Synaphobranchus kaupii TaxID=118154 RepID=A0A9Q1EY82_SYNKA|nr:hypothetical protein SKAU_G00287120 [Synaphobranchus kaupii]
MRQGQRTVGIEVKVFQRRPETHSKSKMADSQTEVPAQADAPVPTPCQVIKEDLDKCVKEKGEDGCKDLLEAFQACLKTAAEAS